MSERYLLKKDNDAHWYLIPMHMETWFSKMLDAIESEMDGDESEFCEVFDKYRINGYHDLTFTDPCDGAGNPLPDLDESGKVK